MKRILVPTDFSTRSDRAIRRAALLARQTSAEIILLHVVDDDQPPRLLQSAEREANSLLQELAATMRESDRLSCNARVSLGEPFQTIIDAAEEVDADLLVMGPHTGGRPCGISSLAPQSNGRSDRAGDRLLWRMRFRLAHIAVFWSRPISRIARLMRYGQQGDSASSMVRRWPHFMRSMRPPKLPWCAPT